MKILPLYLISTAITFSTILYPLSYGTHQNVIMFLFSICFTISSILNLSFFLFLIKSIRNSKLGRFCSFYLSSIFIGILIIFAVTVDVVSSTEFHEFTKESLVECISNWRFFYFYFFINFILAFGYNKKNQICNLITILLLFINTLQAQELPPYITVDPDGYTNIREQPNTSSKIVGQAKRHQIFFVLEDNFCDNEMYSTHNWSVVETNQISGYMFRRHQVRVTDLPSLRLRSIVDSFESGVFVCANDSITVAMHVNLVEKPHDTDKWLYGAVLSDDLERYMKSHGKFQTKVSEFYILNTKTGLKTTIDCNIIDQLYNPFTMRVHTGKDGEFYIYLGLGFEGETYRFWLSIVDGKVVYQIIEHALCI